ncbi:MAG: hypothetical protein ACREQ9_16380, partial [Candidatus Binatia bacterium]
MGVFAEAGRAGIRGIVLLAALGFACAFGGGVFAPEPKLDGRRNFTLAGVTIVNPGKGRREGSTLRVDGDRVESISRDTSASQPLERFRGATVVPGLIDMHVHYWSAEPEAFGLLLLRHGVTSVRDAGDSEAAIFDTRRRIEAGELP